MLVIADVLSVLWLLFHASGALVNLIWLAIIVLVVTAWHSRFRHGGWGAPLCARPQPGTARSRGSIAAPTPDECKNVCNRPDSYTDTVV
jgi:hypothetical protein